MRADDPVLGTAVAHWLASAAPGAPSGLEVELRVVEAPWAGTDTRPALRQPGLTLHYGPPDGGVRAIWQGGRGHAWIPATDGRATLDITRDLAPRLDAWRRPFLLPVLIVLLRRAGWHHLHAVVARDPGGRGWLIAGDAHAGKSTTAALLATRGWAVGTDDTAFVVNDAPLVTAAGWREPIALRAGGLELLQPPGGTTLPRRDKTAFTPEELGGSWVERVPVHVVVTAARHDGPTRLDPAAPADMLGQLLSWSRFFVLEPGLAQAHLDLLGRLVRQSVCFRLHLGRDIFASPDPLRELVP